MPGLRDLIQFATGGTFKTEDGFRFPASAYAYVPDPSKPSTWKIRLWETPDKKETPGQVGRAAAAFSSGGFRGNKAQIPASEIAAVKRKVRAAWRRQNPDKKDADMPESIRMSVEFAVEDQAAGVVRRWGKVFQCGTYEDKNFSLSPEEMAAAAAAFKPIALKSGHPRNPSPLDGKLGWLEDVEVSDDQALYGTLVTPIWVNDALGTAECTVSTEWNPETKMLEGLSLVTNPRVSDAVLMSALEKAEATPKLPEDVPLTIATLDAAVAAGEWPRVVARMAQESEETEIRALVDFATRHDTREGQSTLQELHNTAARYGAVCDPPTANMASRHEADAMQQIHDITVANGAVCSDANKQPSWYFSEEPTVPETAATEPQEETQMTLEEMLRKFFAMAGEETPAPGGNQPTTPPTPPAPPTPPQPAPPVPATMAATEGGVTVPALPDPEKVLLQQEVNRLRAANIESEAAHFADRVIREGRALPVERPALITSYTQAAVDDQRLPGTVTFADGKVGTRVEILEAQLASRKPNMLDGDRLPSELTALINMSETPPPTEGAGTDPETIKRLIGKTPTGAAALEHKNGRSN